MKPGDLVGYKYHDFKENKSVTYHGIVISIQLDPYAFRDSTGVERICMVTVLFNCDVPGWLGSNRLGKVADHLLYIVAKYRQMNLHEVPEGRPDGDHI